MAFTQQNFLSRFSKGLNGKTNGCLVYNSGWFCSHGKWGKKIHHWSGNHQMPKEEGTIYELEKTESFSSRSKSSSTIKLLEALNHWTDRLRTGPTHEGKKFKRSLKNWYTSSKLRREEIPSFKPNYIVQRWHWNYTKAALVWYTRSRPPTDKLHMALPNT